MDTNGTGRVLAVVVTYNGAAWLDRCLGSLLGSTLPVDVLVVDNGSTDGTPAMIKSRFPQVELIQAERNLGFGQANNIGLRTALDRGASHAFLLNQDAWVLPGTIGALVEASAQDGSWGILSPLHLNGPGDALDLNFSNAVEPRRCPGLYSDLALQRIGNKVYEARFVNAAAWLITRECMERVGGFDPVFFHYGEDDNYVARLHYHGLRLGVLPSVVVHHDREQRAENPYFDQERVWQVRRLKLRFADPANNADPEVERKGHQRNLLRAALTLDRASVAQMRDRLKLLEEAELETVVRHRALARTPGPTFL